ncbi:hypothetical protein [Nocardia camponoti]|uniref:Uncharacterized protein n=1 Tax=Nocardia camponoti TaxID=1616106 RepID=A0A917V571_9NOCA|nr:hypothetical protein [Nocardia camponoti]GGK38400.1 hypothetical protein GCM10011591_07580 [Nocardia camponoti]
MLIPDEAVLLDILERAVGGKVGSDGVTVFFPNGVVATQRMNIVRKGHTAVLRSWVGELKPQYTHFYSRPKAVAGLLALADDGWRVTANLHLAYHNCPPLRRWYPTMQLSANEYANYWMGSLAAAGRKDRDEVANPAFERWLVDEGFVSAAEAANLRKWLAGHARQKIDIRPSIALERVCGPAELTVPAIQRVTNAFLSAIGEPLVR